MLLILDLIQHAEIRTIKEDEIVWTLPEMVTFPSNLTLQQSLKRGMLGSLKNGPGNQ